MRKKEDIAAEFNIPSSAMLTILKNQADIQKQANEANVKCKRKRED